MDTVEENGTNRATSDESTPSSQVEPFNPIFKIRVADAVKNGEALQFTIKVEKIKDPDDSFVVRQFEDVEWLDHCIMTQTNIPGLILPPLPPRPESDAKSAESKSKKQLGSSTRIIVGDEFHKDCRNVEKYLRLLIVHETFGRERALENFLTLKEAPSRIKVKKGLVHKISSVVGEVRKGSHRDIDEHFHKVRLWSNDYSTAVKQASLNFNKMVYAQLRLGGAYTHLVTSLGDTSVHKDEATIQVNWFMARLAEAADDAKHGVEVLSNNDENTIGFQLDLYARYIDMVKEMLFRRTCLLVEYEDANKAVDRAKPLKRQAADEAKSAAQKTYEDCTETAKRELKVFHEQRIYAFRDGLSAFAESQVKTARDTYALLVKTLTKVKKMGL